MATIKFNNVYIEDYYTIAGPFEKNGKIKGYDKVIADFYNNADTLENAEIKMQRETIDGLLNKGKSNKTNIELIVGGELSNQLTTTSYAVRNYNFPFLGVYSACASYCESLIILGNMIESGVIKKGMVITSSHNLNSEKQFRFPCEYGSLKPSYTTFTATGCVGNILSDKKGKIKVESGTIGKVLDYGITDVFQMGGVMAPAACEVLARHLKDLKRKPDYYDVIVTGDLGKVGTKIFKDLLQEQYNLSLNNHLDAASIMYKEEQNTYAGASGPTALPLVTFAEIIKSKKYQKILLIATGSLHSPVMVNQKNSIPGIAHAVSLEIVS